jgi:hypothetical protein
MMNNYCPLFRRKKMKNFLLAFFLMALSLPVLADQYYDRSCSAYYDQYNCQAQRDCQWDFQRNYCMDRWDRPNPGPGPGPAPMACYQYYHPSMCERNPSCDWDYRYNRDSEGLIQPDPYDNALHPRPMAVNEITIASGSLAKSLRKPQIQHS